MEQRAKITDSNPAEASLQRQLVAQHLQSIEDNPLDAEDIAMFEMFEREDWPHQRRRAYILERARAAFLVPAAE